MNNPQVETVEKQINFAARAGEVITGELGRDVEGQFINIAEFQADVSREMYLRLRSARLRQKQRQRILDVIGGGGDSKEDAKAKREAEKAANRAETFNQLAERRGMDKGDLEALASFRAGNDIDGETAGRLASQGLVEFDSEGQARMTTAGSGLIRAANRGDIRIAMDRISKGKEQVKKKRERAEKARQKAAEAEKENREIEQEIKALRQQAGGRETTRSGETETSATTTSTKALQRIETLRRRQRRNRLRREASNSLAEDLFQRLGEGIRKSAYPLVAIAKQEPPDEIETEITDYEDQLTGLIEAAHNGQISQDEFSRRVRDIAGVALLALFLRGGDITEVEITTEEKDRLQREIDLADSSSTGLAADVYAGKFQGDDANSITARVGLWGAAAVGVYMLGKVHRRDDPLLTWELGAAEHSRDCLNLAGQTRRASEWLAAGLYPKSGLLDCSLGCQCSFREA